MPRNLQSIDILLEIGNLMMKPTKGYHDDETTLEGEYEKILLRCKSNLDIVYDYDVWQKYRKYKGLPPYTHICCVQVYL